MYSSHTLRVLSVQDTNSLRKLALTKRKQSGGDDKTHLVDKVAMSNNVKVTLVSAQGFSFCQFVFFLQMEASWFWNKTLQRQFEARNPGEFCICVWVSRLFSLVDYIPLVFTLPLPGHHHITSSICWRQVQRGWFSGWFNVWYSPWKRNSFPGQATPESQQGDMKQSKAREALPQYPLPFHSHILPFYRESIFPLPFVR